MKRKEKKKKGKERKEEGLIGKLPTARAGAGALPRTANHADE